MRRKDFEGSSKETYIYSLDAYDKEHSLHGKLDPNTGIKARNLRSNSFEDFEIIQIDDNPLRVVKIGANLSAVVREDVGEFLRVNDDHFVVSPL